MLGDHLKLKAKRAEADGPVCESAPGHGECSSASQMEPTPAVSSPTMRPSPEPSGRLFNDSWSSEAQQQGRTAWCGSFRAGDRPQPIPLGSCEPMRKIESQEPQKEGPGLESVKPKLLFSTI